MKSSFVVLISLILCSFIFPQEKPASPQYALSFGILDNFRLGNFNMDIAVKKIIDDSNQWRLYISPRISVNDQDDDNLELDQIVNINSVIYSFGIGADYLWTLLRNNDLSMFGGSGLVINYGNRKDERTDINNLNGESNFQELNSPRASVGIRGILGIEWKVTDNIGIHSEYLMTGSYDWEKINIKTSLNGISRPRVSRTASKISLFTNVLFGVSFYL